MVLLHKLVGNNLPFLSVSHSDQVLLKLLLMHLSNALSLRLIHILGTGKFNDHLIIVVGVIFPIEILIVVHLGGLTLLAHLRLLDKLTIRILLVV